jgi:hypothetical protein
MHEMTGQIRSAIARRRFHAVPLPIGVLPGLALMAIAFLMDVAVHVATLEQLEPTAHLTGVLGMVLTWSAVVVDGARHIARRD